MRLIRLCGDVIRLIRLCGDAARLTRLCSDATRLSAEHWKEVKAARSLQESRSARGGVELQECRLFEASLLLR
jgi:hypothetical protein